MNNLFESRKEKYFGEFGGRKANFTINRQEVDILLGIQLGC
jgi:hypothetical protein